MLWAKISARNLANDWRLIEKFCRRRKGKRVGRENLFRNIAIIVLNSKKQNLRSVAQAEIFSRVPRRILAALFGLDDGMEML